MRVYSVTDRTQVLHDILIDLLDEADIADYVKSRRDLHDMIDEGGCLCDNYRWCVSCQVQGFPRGYVLDGPAARRG